MNIEELKTKYPQYADIPDQELAEGLRKKYYSNLDKQDFYSKIGLEYKKEDFSPSFLETVQGGYENLRGAGAALSAGVGSLFGNEEWEQAGREGYAQRQAQAQELLQDATDWRDIFDADTVPEGAGRALDYIKEQVGMNSPQMAAIIAGGMAGSKIAPMVGGPIGTAVSKIGGFTTGSFLAAQPMFTGFNLGRQIDEGQELDLPKAAFYATGQAAAESVFASVLTRTGLGETATKILGSNPGIARRITGKIGEAIAIGVPTEVFQQSLERASANLEVMSEDAFDEYLDSAFSAFAQGGGFGVISGIPKGTPKRTQEDISRMLAEEISVSEAPKSNIIKTPEEANQLFNSVNILPDAFPEEAKVKAANILVDRAEQNRLRYEEMIAGVPEGQLTARQLRSSTALQAPIPANQTIRTAQSLDTIGLEALNTEVQLKELADFISPVTPTPLNPEFRIGPRTPVEASTDEVQNQARVVLKYRKKRFSRLEKDAESTIPEIPGYILSDQKNLQARYQQNLSLPLKDLVTKAKEEYNMPEKELKKANGQLLTKKNIADLIAREDGKRLEIENPETKKPYPRFQRDLRYGPEDVATPSLEYRPVSPKVGQAMPFLELANNVKALELSQTNRKKYQDLSRSLDKIVKEIGGPQVSFKPLDTAFEIKDGKMATPLRGLQQGNIVYTALAFNDLAGYSNLENALHEVWHYVYDNSDISVFTENDRSVIEKDLPRIKKVLVEEYGLSGSEVDILASGPEGRSEVVATLFGKYAESRRKEQGSSNIPPTTQKVFNKVIKLLRRFQNALNGLGFKSFEDVFDKTLEGEKAPRKALEDAVYNSKIARMQRIADEIQEKHWESLEENSENLVKEAIEKQQTQAEKLSLYGRTLSSFAHLASKNPILGAAFGIVKEREAQQAQIANTFKNKALKWLSEPSKEVRNYTAGVLDVLRRTNQTLNVLDDGSATYEKDGKTIRILNPETVSIIQSLNSGFKEALNIAEKQIRTALNQIAPGALTSDITELEQTLAEMVDGGASSQEDLAFFEDQIESLKTVVSSRKSGYIPHMRFGEYGFTVYAKDDYNFKLKKPKQNRTPVFHGQVEEGGFRGKYNAYQYKDVQKRLEKYRNDPNFVIASPNNGLDGFEMTYKNVFNKLGNEHVTLEMLSALLGNQKSEDSYKDIKSKIERNVRMGRGFARRFAESRDIEGYSTDWDRVVNSYFSSASVYFARNEYDPLLKDLQTKADAMIGKTERNKQVLDRLNRYIEYMGSPQESFQAVRSLNFIWTMGLNVSSAALQIMTLPTTSLGSMTQYNPNVLENMGLLSKYFSLAMKEFTDANAWTEENGMKIFRLDNPELLKKLKEKHRFNDKQISFVKKMFENNATGAAFTEEMSGVKNYETRSAFGKTQGFASGIVNRSGFMISAMEQATRFATVMAHHELMSNNPKALSKAQEILQGDNRFQVQRKLSKMNLVEDVAMFGLDESHAVFGKLGRGEILRGGLGAFVFPFMTYPQMAVEFLMRMSGRGKEGARALTLTLGSLAFFAGLAGLPGGELFKELLEEIYKAVGKQDIDIDYLIRMKSSEIFGDPRPGLFLTQGVFRAYGGMDVSQRIGLPIVGQDLILAALGVQGDMTDLAGVQGSMATNAIKAWQSYNTDQSGAKVMSLLSPTALSNLLKAYTFYDEGVKTGSVENPKTLVKKEDIRENPGSIVLRAMGVTSNRIADSRDAIMAARQLSQQHRPKMNSFRAKGRTYANKVSEAIEENNKKKKDLYTKKYNDLTDEVLNYLQKNDIMYDIANFHRSIADSVDQAMVGGVRVEDMSRATRDKYDLLLKTFRQE